MQLRPHAAPLRFAIFLHPCTTGTDPTLALHRDLELIEHLDRLATQKPRRSPRTPSGSSRSATRTLPRPPTDYDEFVSAGNDSGQMVIGTPEMGMEQIERLIDETGGFDAFLMLGADFADRAATLRSDQLFADQVMPKFTGQLDPVNASDDQVIGAGTRWVDATVPRPAHRDRGLPGREGADQRTASRLGGSPIRIAPRRSPRAGEPPPQPAEGRRRSNLPGISQATGPCGQASLESGRDELVTDSPKGKRPFVGTKLSGTNDSGGRPTRPNDGGFP